MLKSKNIKSVLFRGNDFKRAAKSAKTSKDTFKRSSTNRYHQTSKLFPSTNDRQKVFYHGCKIHNNHKSRQIHNQNKQNYLLLRPKKMNYIRNRQIILYKCFYVVIQGTMWCVDKYHAGSNYIIYN